ncbi:hypothetical protein QAD02_010980 [Eretmocerus hayati]|uniref:Uncharacterized protein n=1 Tax=Eretmocerus hayati TaxID=131215 RepID=A0ACC2NVS8_9HYME|nr:hypothetical protein QAD02_010980 [Eretmocerus hayati]
MASTKSKLAIKEDALKASNTFLHPKSRKCIAMVKKFKKDNKKEKAKLECKLKQSLVADKLLWFQKHMVPEVCPYTHQMTNELVQKYIARNDEELEQIQIKRSIGGNRNKQHIGREDAIRITKERETCDFEGCGLEIPNILNTAQCNMLKKWNGDLKFLPNFKLIKFRKKIAIRDLDKQKQALPVGKIPNDIKEKDNGVRSETNTTNPRDSNSLDSSESDGETENMDTC